MNTLSKVIKNRVSLALVIMICGHFTYAASPPAISAEEITKHQRFATWQGIEPDKWATIWLIKRHIVPEAYFLFVPPNHSLPKDALPFDVPEVAIRRAKGESMFRRLTHAVQLHSPVIQYLYSIIHDIEVNIWDEPEHEHSPWFETMYRSLQARYQRDQVPVDCYLAFFDGVARLATQENVSADAYRNQLDLSILCPGLSQEQSAMVESLNHLDVLREVSLGKRVVFVDTRENEEYDEVHLPGAQLLRLRDVNQKNVKNLLSADLVVPYCVKDFRGFEVAKSLKQHGVKRVATLSPNGLKGWLAADLPVAGKNQMDEQVAMTVLMQCAMEPSRCGILVPPRAVL